MELTFRLRSCGVMLFLLLLLVGCEEQATPFPVDIPVTPSPTPKPTNIPPVRYALASNTASGVADIERIQQTALVEQLTENTVNPGELGTRFDIVSAYGIYPEWAQSPITTHVMLVINPNAGPLDVQSAFVLRSAVDAALITETLAIPGVEPAPLPEDFIVFSAEEVRSELANMGRPDGFQLAMGYVMVPGAGQVSLQFAEVNVTASLTAGNNDGIRRALETGVFHMAVVTWTTLEEQQVWRDLFGDDYVLNLYTLPISYLAVPGLTITFSKNGWPIATR